MTDAAVGPAVPGGAIRIAARTGDGSAGTVLAYSAFEPYELRAYIEAMAEDLPDIALLVDRMPTAALTRRLLDERAEDRPCLILGWADTAAATPGIAGIMARPDASDLPGAVGGFIRPTAFSVAFVGDRDGLGRRGLAPPAAWSDLAAPALAGSVAFPDPRISGAGFLALTTLLQVFGEAEGWRLMRAIDRNVSAYLPSAWGPAEAVGGGPGLVGVTVRIAAVHRVAQSPDRLVLSLPTGAVGAEAEVYGMTRAARHPDAVLRVLRWLLADRGAGLFSHFAKIDLRQGSEGLEEVVRIDPEQAMRCRADVIARFSSMAKR